MTSKPSYNVWSFSSGRKTLQTVAEEETTTAIETFPGTIWAVAGSGSASSFSDDGDEHNHNSWNVRPGPSYGADIVEYLPSDADWFQKLPPITPPSYDTSRSLGREEGFGLPTNLEENRREWERLFSHEMMMFLRDLGWHTVKGSGAQARGRLETRNLEVKRRRVQLKAHVVNMGRLLLTVGEQGIGFNLSIVQALFRDSPTYSNILRSFFDDLRRKTTGDENVGSWP